MAAPCNEQRGGGGSALRDFAADQGDGSPNQPEEKGEQGRFVVFQ